LLLLLAIPPRIISVFVVAFSICNLTHMSICCNGHLCLCTPVELCLSKLVPPRDYRMCATSMNVSARQAWPIFGSLLRSNTSFIWGRLGLACLRVFQRSSITCPETCWGNLGRPSA
jgi:hypothetical protein